MSSTRDRSVETEGEELQAKRKANKAEPAHKELTPEIILPPEVEAKALTNPRLAPSANLGRKAQVLQSLQRTHGNAYVQRLVAQSSPPQQEEENKTLPPEVAKRLEVARGGGQPLEPGVRGEMEAALGREFGDVRVHADAEADRLTTELGAKAFAADKDIFFRAGTYQTESEAGRETLSHELAHVAQQEGNTEGQLLTLSQPTDTAEVEAAEIGAQVARPVRQRQPRVATSAAPAHTIQRQPATAEAPAEAPAPAPPSPALQAMWKASVASPVNEAYEALGQPTRANLRRAYDRLSSAKSVVSELFYHYMESGGAGELTLKLGSFNNHLETLVSQLDPHLGLAMPLGDIRQQLSPSESDIGWYLGSIGADLR